MTTYAMGRKPGFRSFLSMLGKDAKRYRILYLMVLPVIVHFIVFAYVPMYGLQIAFKDFDIAKGYWASPWVGLDQFKVFFEGFYFERLFRNTLLINVYGLIFGFPAPILFALLLNEVRVRVFKRTIQTLSYLPHFISMVVICGMIIDFTRSDGLINNVIALLGGKRTSLLQRTEVFRTIYVASGIWQGLGWSSIVYIAALAGVNPELYQAAVIDGAGRLRQAWHITLPGIQPTIIILLIMNMGSMFSVGAEKILLLYNPATYETADVISTYVYRMGLGQMKWSFGAAVGLFNSVLNFILLAVANRISRLVTETSLW